MHLLIETEYDYGSSWDRFVACSKNLDKINELKTELEEKEQARRLQADKCIECVFLFNKEDVKNYELFIKKANKKMACSGFCVDENKYLYCKNNKQDIYATNEYEIKEIIEI